MGLSAGPFELSAGPFAWWFWALWGDAWPEVGLILRKKRDYNPCAQYGLKYSVLYFAFDSHALLPRANPLSRTPVREFAQT